MWPVLNKGIKNPANTGAYIQTCIGCTSCSGPRRRVFRITDPLSRSILDQEPLASLLLAREEELYPEPRRPSARSNAARATVAAAHAAVGTILVPSSPSPPPPATPATTPSPEPTDVPLPDAMVDDLPAVPVTPSNQRLPSNQHLTFDNGGYGGYHYSPSGYIIRSSPSSAADGTDPSDDAAEDAQSIISTIPELQYPVDVLDLCTPVVLFAWFDALEAPIQTMVQPRADEDSSIRIGEVVLNDFRSGLKALGFPSTVHIEHFIDVTDHWIPINWNTGIPIYGRNKVIYIRQVGVNVTPPDHFIDLLQLP
ncbi:hypothetical protein DFH09DRAFT_1141459 [Mycena vulgaris]|nr:hypothetical protein DFH09DRAFT_1141442 [Mycena vulgaris]KAJ6587616.1 hypothetical protein DFH09DRAFT_1141459 [Mycena vulgaris]